MRRRVASTTLLMFVSAGASCFTAGGPCDQTERSGTGIQYMTATADPVDGRPLLGWTTTDYTGRYWTSRVHVAKITAEGDLVEESQVDVPYSATSRLELHASAGRRLLFDLEGGEWAIVSAAGDLVRPFTPVPWVDGETQWSLAVPDGFLLVRAYRLIVPVTPMSRDFEVAVTKVDLDGNEVMTSVVARGATGPGLILVALAQADSAVWIAFHEDSTVRAIRIDWNGRVLSSDSILTMDSPADTYIRMAGSGGRAVGLVSTSQGTVLARFDAQQLVSSELRTGLLTGDVAGFGADGFLAGATWLDRDGATVGTLDLGREYCDSAVVGSAEGGVHLTLRGTCTPSSSATTRTTVFSRDVAFGDPALGPEIERVVESYTSTTEMDICPGG